MSEQQFLKNSQNLLSSTNAAKAYGVTNDYIARLARKGQLRGRLEGRLWMVEKDSLVSFFATRDRMPIGGMEKLFVQSEQKSVEQKSGSAYAGSAAWGGPRTFEKRISVPGVSLQAPSPLRAARRPYFIAGTMVAGILSLFFIVGAFAMVGEHTFPESSTAAVAQVDSPFFGSNIFSKLFGFLFGNKSAPTALVTNTSQPTATSSSGQTSAAKNSPASSGGSSVVNNYTNNTTNNNTYNTTNSYSVAAGSITQTELDKRLNSLRSEVFSSINSPNPPSYAGGGVTNNIALTQIIDKLDGVTISNSTVHHLGGLTPDDIPALQYLASTGGTISGDLTITGTCTGCGSGASTDFSYGNNYGAVAAATTTPLWAQGGVFASSTSHFTSVDFTSATSTNFYTSSLTVSGIASTSQLFGANLNTCNSGNVLTWSGGVFGCAADQTAAGAANPFIFATNYTVLAAATSSPIWAQSGIFASSTSHFVSADFINSTTTGNAYFASKIGIGTTSPFAKLSIDASGSNVTPLAIKTNGSAGNYTPANSGLFVYDAAGNETLRIFASDPNDNNYNSANLYIGKGAGIANPTDNSSAGYYNTGIGYSALSSNTTGGSSVSVGYLTLAANTTGYSQVAVGSEALRRNTTSWGNVAVGTNALTHNTTGEGNTASGYWVQYLNTTGSYNTALGTYALYSNLSATNTVAVGYAAGAGTTNFSAQGGTYVGYNSGTQVNTGSDYNTFLGYQSGFGVTSGAGNIVIGANIDAPSAAGFNQLNIGNLLYGTGIYSSSGSSPTVSSAPVAGGKIGIGTTSPFAKLSIDTRNSTSTPFAIRTTGVAGAYTATSTGIFVYDAAGAETLRILASDPNTSNYNSGNLFIGNQAGASNPADNSSAGYFNTGTGFKSLFSNTTGAENTAQGYQALLSNRIGGYSVAFGSNALGLNTTGNNNVALGAYTSYNNVSATNTVAIGEGAAQGTAPYSNKGGTFVGTFSGTSLTSGSDYNTALGYSAGYDITSGYGNTFVGAFVNGSGITSGGNNISIGYNSFFPSATANNQLNIGGLIFGSLPATSSSLVTNPSGTIGVGTTSPYARLAVQAFAGQSNPVFEVASSSSANKFFSVSNTGSTTLFQLPSSLLKTNANGTIIAAIAGTDYLTSASVSPYPFSLAGNATSTLTQFNGGLSAFASSTIGAGGQATGLTISGGATTTGNAYFAGNVGIGTTTSYGNLTVSGGASYTGTPGYGIASIGTLNNTNGWVGNGFLFSNANSGSGDFSMVFNGDKAYYGSAGANTVWATLDSSTFSLWTGLGNTKLALWQNAAGSQSIGLGVQANQLLLHLNNSTDRYSFYDSVGLSNELLTIKGTGNIGIASTSPFSKFSIHANNGEVNTTLFAIGSTTASATSTLFSISNTGSTTLFQIPSSLLKTNAGGTIVAAVAGTDYLTSANASPYPFQLAGNATSTLTQFNGGLTAYASSTIGAGGQATGLTISGGATTTGNAYFAGNVGVGTTNPGQRLVVGDVTSQNTLRINGSNTTNMAPLLSLWRQSSREGVVAITSSGKMVIANSSGLADYNDSTIDASANLTISSTGNVGINTTNPLYSLHVAGTNGYLALQANSNNSGDNTGIKFKTSSQSPDTYFKGGIFYQSTADTSGRGNILFAQNNVNDSSNVTTANAVMVIQPNGNLGIGTTSPYAKFSIHNNNGDTNTMLFAIGSSTATATSTLFSISNTGSTTLFRLNSSLLKTDSNGTIVAAVSGVDYLTSANASPYPFQLAGNATSTLTQFNGGLTAYASSTIGNGNQNGGLTISGGATTTGNAYFAGNVGIGTTSPSTLLTVGGGGTGSENPGLTINGGSGTNGGPYLAFQRNSGNTSFIGPASGVVGGTSNDLTFVGLGGTNIRFYTGNVESARITSTGNLGLGTTTPYAKLSVEGSSALGNSALAGYFIATSTTATSTFAGYVGIGTSTPWGNGLLTVGTSSPLLYIDKTSGNVGIGTSTPSANLTVASAAPQIKLIASLGSSLLLSTSDSFSAFSYNIQGGNSYGLRILNTTGAAWLGLTASTLGVTSSGLFSFGASTNPESPDSALSRLSAGVIAIGNGTAGNTSGGLIAASSTIINLTAITATTTNLSLTSLPASLLKTNSNGTIIAAVAGTDYLTSANASPYPFQLAGNATSTLTQFNGGLTAYASSTIGSGTAGGGLTVSGNSTTTGNIYLARSGQITFGSPGVTNYDYLLAADGFGFIVGGSGQSTITKIYYGGVKVNPTNGMFSFTNDASLNNSDAAFSRISAGVVGLGNGLFGNIDATLATGRIGLGTTSPYAQLSIIATSTNGVGSPTTLFAIASTTGGTATSTLFSISNTGSTTLFQLSSSLLKTNTNGTIIAAVSGTDYLTSANASPYPFQLAGNATSTLTQFNGGLTAYASSTIGNGNQNGGLTINGGATTTGNAYFAGNVGVGTANPSAPFEVVNGTNSWMFNGQFLTYSSSGSTRINLLDSGGTSYLQSSGGKLILQNTDNVSAYTLVVGRNSANTTQYTDIIRAPNRNETGANTGTGQSASAGWQRV